MGLFNNKRDDDIPQQDLQELFQRLEHLERKCRRMEARIAELEEDLISQRNKAASAVMDSPEATAASADEQEQPVEITMTVDSIAATATASSAPVAAPAPSRVETAVLFLPAPTADGLFVQATESEQIGKSIYQLTTADNQSGTFILLDTPDAIATAMISVSTFIKPVCRVDGPTAQFPRHIVTVEEGTAAREGAGWRVTRKAVVRFE